MKKTLTKTISVILAMLIVFQTTIIGAYATTKNEESAICQIRDNMVKRNESFTVDVGTDELNILDLINKAMSEEYSNSNEAGDYLLWTYLKYDCKAINYSNDKCTLQFDVLYRTTREQELLISQKVKEIAKSISNKTDYEKIKAIHDYIVDNVSYNTTSKNCSTAYGAIYEGKAACQGYTTLFYRLCKEVGIDTRIVTGDGHAWNIVKLNGVYYNIDCTWDDTNDIKTYAYFLKCDKDFDDHYIIDSPYKTSEFINKYNKTTECYGGCNNYNNSKEALTKSKSKPSNKTTTSISKITSGKKKFTVKWKKKSCTGYQVQYSTSSKFKSSKTATVKSNKTTSKTIKGLKSKKKYYVRVRTYKTINGQKIYSSWSKTKTVKIK